MNMTEIRARARKMGVKPKKLRKTELIRTIQRHENNPECYRTGRNSCPEMTCCWRSECQKQVNA